jgi:hypothetical protein
MFKTVRHMKEVEMRLMTDAVEDASIVDLVQAIARAIKEKR